jgi:methylmalonyl-CoA/ethylmalonyl-CoA epimerase
MLGRIEHVALAVKDLDAAIRHYHEVWGLTVSTRETVAGQGVEEAMLPAGGACLQLIAPTAPDSTVARFIDRRGEGLHHIAFEVDDLGSVLARLRAAGAALIDDEPRRGGGGHLVAFVHPSANHGVLVELVQRTSASPPNPRSALGGPPSEAASPPNPRSALGGPPSEAASPPNPP